MPWCDSKHALGNFIELWMIDPKYDPMVCRGFAGWFGVLPWYILLQMFRWLTQSTTGTLVHARKCCRTGHAVRVARCDTNELEKCCEVNET